MKAQLGTVALFSAAALAVVQFYQPPDALLHSRFGAAEARPVMPQAALSAAAFGRSGAVQVRFALPGDPVEYPIQVAGDPAGLAYRWISVTDSAGVDSVRLLSSDTLTAPPAPGFYHLAIVRGLQQQIIEGLTLAVMVPFDSKSAGLLNGYRIGTFLSERRGARKSEHPEGFLQILPELVDLRLSKHLRLGSFITPDGQQSWPRYAAVNARLLDKLELVLAQVARLRPDSLDSAIAVSVSSGFRTPLYNRSLFRAARDSRHQYGDAADLMVDADGDGRMTARDTRVIAAAVEIVEQSHPDLAGGLGIYTSRRYRQPYVHIDARGRRARWRG